MRSRTRFFACTFAIVGRNRDERDGSQKRESRKARIFDEESPVCTIGNRTNCYDPDSIKKAFHPLGIYSKCFGLFPCYDFSFVENLSDGNVRMIHILDYCYSVLIFLVLTGGGLLCHVYKPNHLRREETKLGGENIDYYAKLALIYCTIFAGVQSLFIFPMKWNQVVNFVRLFSNVDKILRFDGRDEERWFAKKVILYLTGCLVFTLASNLILFILDGSGVSTCFSDFLMPPLMTLALMALIIPTGLAVFFLNAVRLRMMHFNRKMTTLLTPLTPSCFICISFQDYGKELDEMKLDRKPEQFAEDLEKMRILHCEIATLGKSISCIFGTHLVRDFLYSLVGLVMYTYFLIYIQDEGDFTWIMYAGQNAFILLKLLVLACFAQLICCEGSILRASLQRVSLRRLDESSCLQIQVFLGAVGNLPVISAAGFFNLDRALMTSILGAITTYFIILLQFKVGGGLQKITEGSA
ncbi:unnamed protein product [Orchesella dallaii]|uniref:Gustatory receptor n=1 Tax=Orchesella dallaii TaxID=48710 RepID=A0ABP1Q144_9HEXA